MDRVVERISELYKTWQPPVQGPCSFPSSRDVVSAVKTLFLPSAIVSSRVWSPTPTHRKTTSTASPLTHPLKSPTTSTRRDSSPMSGSDETFVSSVFFHVFLPSDGPGAYWNRGDTARHGRCNRVTGVHPDLAWPSVSCQQRRAPAWLQQICPSTPYPWCRVLG